MKVLKRIMPILLAVVLCFTALPMNVAAKEVEAGASTSVSLGVTSSNYKVFGGKGTINVNDPKGIVESYSISSGLSGFTKNGGTFAFASSSEITSGSVKVDVKIKSSAPAGSSCTVSLTGYSYVDEDDNMVSVGAKGSETITVKAKPSGGGSNTGGSGSSSSGSSSSSSSSNKKPAKVDKTDYSELKNQIGIAEGLTKDGYTKESWENLQEALNAAYNAVGCGDQNKVDAAAKALADAIAALEKMDYSKLQAAMDSADNLITSDELAEKWNKLFQLLLNGETLLTSDDQAAVDAAADEINALLDEIKALLGLEEEVAAEPEEDYCNIPMHKVWPILFFISLALNVLFVALLLTLKKKKEEKRKRRTDDTPMVDYQIGDDDK